MKQNDIKDKKVKILKSTNLANIFNIYLNEQGKYVYNMLNSVYIPKDLNPTLYTAVFPLPGEYLTQFSHRMYNTIDLAWLIAETNGIMNMLEPLDPTKPLRVIKESIIKNILLRVRKGE
jgi:hypothetical protein